jgi:glycerol kinase
VSGDLILAIDEGTSSARAIAYDADWQPVATAARRLTTDHPQPGWAEQDAEAIVVAVVEVVAEVLETVGGPGRIAAAGLANQGETVVAWDRHTGAAIAPAVLWSCRRSQEIVERIGSDGHRDWIRERTGLPLDPYFSASKLRWLLEEVPNVASAAESGRLAVGTVDAWVTARLGTEIARTDPSTASRTQLFGLADLDWDDELLGVWGIPSTTLPMLVPTTGDLGSLTHPSWGGEIPLRAMVCDQQAALAGQGGHGAGTIKATFGTGVFVLANAGVEVPEPPDGILATVAWGSPGGPATYALDGGVFSAGAFLDWLHHDIGLLDAPAMLDDLASQVTDTSGVRMLPALAGLGAPWWDADVRVTISGLSATTRRPHLARAALDAIAQRTVDIVEAMAPVLPSATVPLRVDGGLTGSALLVERLADLAGRSVDIATDPESTALGTALLAAIGAGRIEEDAAAAVAGTKRRVEPRLDEAARRAERSTWIEFVDAARALAPERLTRST